MSNSFEKNFVVNDREWAFTGIFLSQLTLYFNIRDIRRMGYLVTIN